jgi:hypothetical protein
LLKKLVGKLPSELKPGGEADCQDPAGLRGRRATADVLRVADPGSEGRIPGLGLSTHLAPRWFVDRWLTNKKRVRRLICTEGLLVKPNGWLKVTRTPPAANRGRRHRTNGGGLT